MAALLALALGEAPAPELLARLAAHDDRMEKYLDTHKVTIDVKSTEGDAVLSSERKNGQIHTTIVSAKDPSGEQKRAKERDEKNERTESPFAPRNQPKYTFSFAGSEGSLVKLRFAPKTTDEDRLCIGEAWVDPEAGEVVSVAMKPQRLPFYLDRLDLKLEYEARGEGVGRMLSKFSMLGKGGFLFIKKEGGATMTFKYLEPDK